MIALLQDFTLSTIYEKLCTLGQLKKLFFKKKNNKRELSNDLDMHFCFRTNYIDFFFMATHFFIKSEHYGLVMMCNVILLFQLFCLFSSAVVVQKNKKKYFVKNSNI